MLTLALMQDSDPLGLTLKRAQVALRQTMDAALGEHGLTMAQYAALAALADATGLTNAELARRCFVTPQTMIRIVTGLDDDGSIDRHPDPSNNRRILNSITTAGTERIAGAEHVVRSTNERMLAGLTAAERSEYNRFLLTSIENLAR